MQGMNTSGPTGKPRENKVELSKEDEERMLALIGERNLELPVPSAWFQEMMTDALAEAIKAHHMTKLGKKYSRYRQDPVLFGKEILNTEYTDDIKKVMYSVRDNPVTIAKSATAVGKTHSAAHLALWWYKCFPNSEVYLTAAPPLENLKRLLWGELVKAIGLNPTQFKGDKLTNLFLGQPKRKHWIAGLSIPTSGSAEERESKFSGKHNEYLLFIVDEGDAVPDEIYKGIDGCMSGGHSRLLILFNPKIQVGPIWNKERDGMANIVTLSAINHPNVVTGEDVIKGAVTREKTVARINEWTRPIMEGESILDDCFEIPEFLEGCTAVAPNGVSYPPLKPGTRKIMIPDFSYKVLGQYPSQGENQLISEEWLSAARARWDAYVVQFGERPPEGVRPRAGLDVAELGPDSNVLCRRYGGWVARMIQWDGVDTDETARMGLEHYRTFEPELMIVDATGLGSNVAPSMIRLGRPEIVRAVGVKSSERPSRLIKCELGEFQYLRDQLWWACREWLRTDPGAMLPPDNLLLEELKAPTYGKHRRTGKIIVTDKEQLRKVLRRSPDRADALCLTFAPVHRAKVVGLED
jgi:phage terminase large subunit